MDARVPEGTILLIGRLVNEAEDMKDAANGALKDAWADFRESLKGLGLTGKEVSEEVAQFKAAISRSRMSQTETEKALAKADGAESYLAVLASPRARAHVRAA